MCDIIWGFEKVCSKNFSKPHIAFIEADRLHRNRNDIGVTACFNYRHMEFMPLEKVAQLDGIKDAKGVTLIFKHNTTCPISRSMRSQFEQDADGIPNVASVYMLDLLTYRDLSDAVAEQFNVPHESPQLLVIRDGQCISSQSLYDISAEETAAVIA